MNFDDYTLTEAKSYSRHLARNLSYYDTHASEYKSHEHVAIAFTGIEKLPDLAILLNHKVSELIEIINNPKYQQFNIPKKKGGSRIILAPGEELKQIQFRINYLLQGVYYGIKPKNAHGFIRKPVDEEMLHNIVSNAKPHAGKKFVMNIDLKDYFPSITASQVKNLFQSRYFQLPENIAIALALLCTYQKRLPVGSPASPVIANLITMPLDRTLEEYCSENDIIYTRYADDLTFSRDEYFADETINGIKRIVSHHKFTVNEKKFRIQSAMRQQTVTGLIVNRKVNVDRKYIRKIRAMLHHVEAEGVRKAAQKHFKMHLEPNEKEVKSFINRLKGMIDFVGMVKGKDDQVAAKLEGEFKRCINVCI